MKYLLLLGFLYCPLYAQSLRDIQDQVQQLNNNMREQTEQQERWHREQEDSLRQQEEDRRYEQKRIENLQFMQRMTDENNRLTDDIVHRRWR